MLLFTEPIISLPIPGSILQSIINHNMIPSDTAPHGSGQKINCWWILVLWYNPLWNHSTSRPFVPGQCPKVYLRILTVCFCNICVWQDLYLNAHFLMQKNYILYLCRAPQSEIWILWSTIKAFSSKYAFFFFVLLSAYKFYSQISPSSYFIPLIFRIYVPNFCLYQLYKTNICLSTDKGKYRTYFLNIRLLFF